jgi:hypothetical protein
MGRETFQQTKGSMDILNNPFSKASQKHRWESNKKRPTNIGSSKGGRNA